MSVRYLDLADFIGIAVAVTGLDVQTVLNVTNLDLADSALHAPSAGFGDEDKRGLARDNEGLRGITRAIDG